MTDWLSALLASDAPALPAAWAMRLHLSLGWALVLALAGTLVGARLKLPMRRGLALLLMGWTLLPGPLTPDYWLGLAFHAPSLAATLLCAGLLQQQLFPAGLRQAWPQQTGRTVLLPSGMLAMVWLALLLGYALLLDTFAVLPLGLYAWGFSPAALLVLLALSLLPWVFGGARGPRRVQWVAPLSLLLFAATRLPTGNVWDALLDPWLWLLLHGVLLRDGYRRWRA
jgi:hypothetical protein